MKIAKIKAFFNIGTVVYLIPIESQVDRRREKNLYNRKKRKSDSSLFL